MKQNLEYKMLKTCFIICVIIFIIRMLFGAIKYVENNTQLCKTNLDCSSLASDATNINGCANLSNQEYDSLKINGNLTFKDLVVKNFFIINGISNGKNLKCNTFVSNGSFQVEGFQAKTIECNGSFSGEDIDIAEKSKFNGSLEIKNAKLHDVEIKSKHSTLTETKVNGSILVKETINVISFPRLKSIQILELKGKSLVTGDIIFEQAGEIHVFDEAKVEGKIVNAKVIQK